VMHRTRAPSQLLIVRLLSFDWERWVVRGWILTFFYWILDVASIGLGLL